MKAETKVTHIPGPWHYDVESRTVRVKEWKNNPFMGDYRGCIIADFNASIGHDPDAHGRDFAIPEAEANARLIAAAPDLLARLRECVDYLYAEADNAEDRNNGLIAECEAAIRKATSGDE